LNFITFGFCSSQRHGNTSFEPDIPLNQYQDCYNFLVKYMPERDVNVITDLLLNETITYALIARNRFSYASKIPWDIFQNDVLPYMIMNEARDNWRKFFYLKFASLADEYDNTNDLAVYMANNMWTIMNIVWQSDTAPWVMSPFEVTTYGYASCTGHSIALVAALRAVGVPSRVSGTIWNMTCTNGESIGGSNVRYNALDDNHSWFEVWDKDVWSFCDANSCPNGLNNTWFYPTNTNCQSNDNANFTIYATSYKTTPNNLKYVMPWAFQDFSVNAYNVTNNYHNYTS